MIIMTRNNMIIILTILMNYVDSSHRCCSYMSLSKMTANSAENSDNDECVDNYEMSVMMVFSQSGVHSQLELYPVRLLLHDNPNHNWSTLLLPEYINQINIIDTFSTKNYKS